MSQPPSVIQYSRSPYDSYQRPNTTTSSVGFAQDPRYPIPQENNPTLQRSRFVDRSANTNYDQYKKRATEYKYNIFSLIDQPWNRCCQVGRCGNCPGNQCIARRAPKLDWI